MEASEPILEGLEITKEQQQLAEGLLNAVVANWTILGESSIQGIREIFLQREGRLIEQEKSWELIVERKTVDVLVDQIPWGISMINLPWLEKIITIKWTKD